MHCATDRPIPSLSINEKPVPAPPLFAVIVRYPPKSLSSHETRKNVIEWVVGLEQSSDIEMRRGTSELRVLVNYSNEGQKIAGSLKNIDANMSVQVNTKEFVGIIKRVPEVFEASLTDLVKKCYKSKRRGICRAFKLYFPSGADLNCVLTNSLNLGFERFPIEFYRVIPRTRY